MAHRTIYLNSDDVRFIEAHRAEIGDSLSRALMEGLRMVTAKKELERSGFEEIRLETGGPGARQVKVFEGRLVARSTTTEHRGTVEVSRRIYTTPKGSWVFFERSSANWNHWTFGGADADRADAFDPNEVEDRRVFHVGSSLDELAAVAPADLVDSARHRTGSTASAVEHLDI